MLNLAIWGAAGNMGTRACNRLRTNREYNLLFVEVMPPGVEKLRARGDAPTEPTEAAKTADVVLFAIADMPNDNTHRLVYADWLEERGDPRAEWLRLQQTLASPVPDAGRYRDLCAREQELWRALDPVWLHAVRRFTTAPPCRDIAKLVPALAPFARTTTRLHPRRTPAPLPAWMSKIGGLCLWPESEHWPECPECRVPLAPVIQLRASDVPLIEFPPGMDLFQLFWCVDMFAHGGQPSPTDEAERYTG